MDKEYVGQQIKFYRKERRLTQKELATRIGKTESSIRKYEKGLVEIPLNVIEDIAAALEIKVNNLYKYKENDIDVYLVPEFQMLDEIFCNCGFIKEIDYSFYDEDCVVEGSNPHSKFLGMKIVDTSENEYFLNVEKLLQFQSEIKAFIRFKLSFELRQ